MRSLYYIQYFPSFQSMQGKEQSALLEKAMVLIYRYMDYWIPLFAFLTFPIWILPGLVYYSLCSISHFFKGVKTISKNLISSKTKPQEISYAILRGNGRYLREEGDDVHKKQFYDYTSRRFMSIGAFEPQTKIIELQCQSDVGLQFFEQSINLGTVVGVHSQQQALSSEQVLPDAVDITDYQISGEPVGYDCMLLFDFKDKVRYSESKIDLLKILAYCKYHMHPAGYLVFGDYFEKGEVETFIELFKAFKLKVVDQQDITRNIEYAKKLQQKHERYEQKMIKIVGQALNKINQWRQKKIERKFIVMIIQKEA